MRTTFLALALVSLSMAMFAADQENYASLIDHTNLKPDATSKDIDKLCDEAKEYKFASVCVNPCRVKQAAENLKGSGIPVCTVIGFPLGANTTAIKYCETTHALMDGATEIDMVVNIAELKAGNSELVEHEIREVVQAAQGHVVKVILETAILDDDETILGCKCANKAGAHFVKTSTGCSTAGGATVEKVKLMKETVGTLMGVKASGGIRDLETMQKMIDAGATRIGTSAGVALVKK